MATTDLSVSDLSKAMATATDDIKREVSKLVDAAAVTMANMLRQRYPVGKTGNLSSRIIVTSPKTFTTTSTGVTIPAKRVRALSPHVHIWQVGTGERFDATRANARRGRMPAGGKVFEETAAQVRSVMLRMAQDILNQNREI